MTPSSRWMFLGMLALANIALSVPPPLVTDACSLICNPGAETEEDRLRDPKVFPRIPKASCAVQSGDDNDQARIIMRHCLKLCSFDLTVDSVANCAAMLSTFAAELGCYCEALSPLSPNTHRLGEQWRLDALVEYLSQDLFTMILNSELDTLILCDIFNEQFMNRKQDLQPGRIIESCKAIENQTRQLHSSRQKRDTSRQETLKEDMQKDDPKKEDEQPAFDFLVDDEDNFEESIDDLEKSSKDVASNTETLYTSQNPDKKLNPGDEVYDYVKNKKLDQSVLKKCSVVDVADSSTPEETTLKEAVKMEISRQKSEQKEDSPFKKNSNRH
ncbi:uncharacterized protein LOC109852341 [Pseudomyrmex gracilis]|uniref:uncharacterized protein LOC109852341 n=1 Tax=Pseudomyrmex gracilis TaxID=219809 RepID=UPI000994BD35|nr:uncharacterized protein LOC109852341 [Pseudomyrmex gracilis]